MIRKPKQGKDWLLLKPKGARKLHWRDMRPSLRGKVVDAMAAMDIDHVIVAAVPMSQWNTAERARRKCLERLLPLLETEYNVDTLVLERREISQDRNDIRFIDGLRSRRFIGPIRVELCAGETDARLWLPDQLLGAYGDARPVLEDTMNSSAMFEQCSSTVIDVLKPCILHGKPTPLGKWK